MKHEQKLSVKPVFVKSRNVNNFLSMLAALALSAGEGRFGLVWGQAGRGKTRAAQWFIANNPDCLYILTLKVWRYSPGEFLKAIARELGMTSVPSRVGPLFTEVAERLSVRRPTIFVDEPEKLPLGFLEILRDLTESTAAPIVLIGEKELPGMMKKERRVWSRTYQELEFQPFGVKDIVQYVTASAGVRFTSPGAAEAMHKSSGGDIRIVRRDLINLVQVLNAKGVAEADESAVAAAVRLALTGGEDDHV